MVDSIRLRWLACVDQRAMAVGINFDVEDGKSPLTSEFS
jgi:hypothetical protein